jgi:hypothetical protein
LSGNVLTVIPASTKVLSASAKPREGWYGVTYKGQTGWVSGKLISLVRTGKTPAEPGSTPSTTSLDLRKELGASGTPGRIAIAIGYAEGSVSTTGSPLSPYFGHWDSNTWNIGLWSCTVCGAQGELTPTQANKRYYTRVLEPQVDAYQQLDGGRWAGKPTMAATFFGLLVQSPEAALQDANSQDLALISILKRGEIRLPLTENKLVEALMRTWTVNGRVLHSLGAAGGEHDQRRRVRAYADSLKAQGINPY